MLMLAACTTTTTYTIDYKGGGSPTPDQQHRCDKCDTVIPQTTGTCMICKSANFACTNGFGNPRNSITDNSKGKLVSLTATVIRKANAQNVPLQLYINDVLFGTFLGYTVSNDPDYATDPETDLLFYECAGTSRDPCNTSTITIYSDAPAAQSYQPGKINSVRLDDNSGHTTCYTELYLTVITLAC